MKNVTWWTQTIRRKPTTTMQPRTPGQPCQNQPIVIGTTKLTMTAITCTYLCWKAIILSFRRSPTLSSGTEGM